MIAALLAVPPFLLWLLALVVALAIACGGQIYVQRRFRDVDTVPFKEGGSPMIGMVGTLYAVLLGFLTVVSWQHFYDSREIASQEAAADTDVWHAAVALPADRRARVRNDMLKYAVLMIDSEWGAMRTGRFDAGADVALMDAIGAAASFDPAKTSQSNAQSATLRQLTDLHDLRQRRLAHNSAGLPWFDWLVLLGGAGCIIAICWLFGVANERVHLVTTALVAVLMTSTLVLLFELQYPFRGGLGISAGDWVGVVDHIHFMQNNSGADMRM